MVTDQLALPAVDIALQHNHPDIFEPDTRMASDLGHFVLEQMERSRNLGPNQGAVVAALYLCGKLTVDQIVETTHLFPGLELNKLQARKALQTLGFMGTVTGIDKKQRGSQYFLLPDFVEKNEQEVLARITDLEIIKRTVDLDQVFESLSGTIDGDPSLIAKSKYQKVLKMLLQKLESGVSETDFDEIADTKALSRLVSRLNASFGHDAIIANDQVKKTIFSMSLEFLKNTVLQNKMSIPRENFDPNRFLPAIRSNRIYNSLCAPILAILSHYKDEGILPDKIAKELCNLGYVDIDYRRVRAAVNRLRDVGLVAVSNFVHEVESIDIKNRRIHRAKVMISPDYDPELFAARIHEKRQHSMAEKRGRQYEKAKIARAIASSEPKPPKEKPPKKPRPSRAKPKHTSEITAPLKRVESSKALSLSFAVDDDLASSIFESMALGVSWEDLASDISEDGMPIEEAVSALLSVVTETGVKLFSKKQDGSIVLNSIFKNPRFTAIFELKERSAEPVHA